MAGFSLGKTATGTTLLLLAAGASMLGYRLVRSDVEAAVYRARLADISDDYAALRSRYNEAVRRTAITELVVEDGKLSVVLRSADGVIKTIDTPYDPSREIFVDYVLLGGRLWIRRVYDAATPPSQAMVIDPELASIDWEAPTAAYGKVVYRALEAGRWVISVTGDGSLNLARAPQAATSDLVAAPEVRQYQPIEAEVDDRLEHISFGDLWRAMTGG